MSCSLRSVCAYLTSDFFLSNFSISFTSWFITYDSNWILLDVLSPFPLLKLIYDHIPLACLLGRTVCVHQLSGILSGSSGLTYNQVFFSIDQARIYVLWFLIPSSGLGYVWHQADFILVWYLIASLFDICLVCKLQWTQPHLITHLVSSYPLAYFSPCPKWLCSSF